MGTVIDSLMDVKTFYRSKVKSYFCLAVMGHQPKLEGSGQTREALREQRQCKEPFEQTKGRIEAQSQGSF